MTWKATRMCRAASKQMLMFRIQDDATNEEATCGATQVAINDYCKTEDNMEHTEKNFNENQEFICV